MAEIKLTQGNVAIVDDADLAWLSQWKWWAHVARGYVYAVRKEGTRKNNRMIYMHRLILGLEKGEMGDHRDGDTLNNRRVNLRRANYSQNNRNAAVRKDNRLGLKGVRADKKNFSASIFVDGRSKHLGNFSDPIAAATAYDRAARLHFGEFARLNFPEEVAA